MDYIGLRYHEMVRINAIAMIDPGHDSAPQTKDFYDELITQGLSVEEAKGRSEVWSQMAKSNAATLRVIEENNKKLLIDLQNAGVIIK